jgi:oxygen-independent coproporphyrinogen-3 oxidase
MAKEEGFENVGIDLIYGLPGQTRNEWRATMERALTLGPSHLSCYQLTAEGEAPLRTMVAGGTLRLPGDRKARDLFLLTSHFLESHGFIHYEVSNFAVSRRKVCRHNEKYWQHTPYLGLGPSAHSFDGSRRWWNVRSVDRYCQLLDARLSSVEETESLSAEQLDLERLYLGLRTSAGIKQEDLPDNARPILDRLKKAGLLRLEKDRVLPTVYGFLVADSLPVLLS